MYLCWRLPGVRCAPRKRLHGPPRRTSPRESVRTSNENDEVEVGTRQRYPCKQIRRSKRNKDVSVISVDSPVLDNLTKEKKLKKSSTVQQNEIQPQPNERHLPALTPEMESIINSALSPEDGDEVLCEGFDISLTRNDLNILHGEEWLSDQIISFYMGLIVERSTRRRLPSVFAFNTFFFTKLLSGSHKAVARWTRKVDIFSFDIVLIPVHKKRGHWCLSIIDFRHKKILYYDPIRKTNYACLYSLRDYLKAECMDKKNTVFDMSSWKYENVKNVPIQESDNDCGVFILKYAELYCKNSDTDFTQDDVQYFRKCMVYELILKKLL